MECLSNVKVLTATVYMFNALLAGQDVFPEM